MGKNGLLIQNLLPSKKRSLCEKLPMCPREMTNQKEKIQEMNHQMENQMENLLIRIGQQKKVKKMALKDSQKRENLITRC